MDLPGYVALSRVTGLDRELSVIANNIANMSTAGFRREDLVSSEAATHLPQEGTTIAMSTLRARYTDEAQGSVERTGRALDLAIDGAGYFQVALDGEQFLTRAGNFSRTLDGGMVLPSGAALLDAGGAPVLIPPDAGEIAIAPDGTLSADGAPLAQIGVWQVADGAALTRRDGVIFTTDVAPEPALGTRLLQGALEGSNVSPVTEMARMIEVQRAYEQGQSFLSSEDERIRAAIRALGEAR
ncbi:flagellar basal-body rod protein FlgF [Rubricella aquisinus]|uniref:Flagellar basal-body rod protein FlgF n=1 Tax=Rubricella aquisinus TaxID=2028108 RepID=A0A840WNK0_9RHOB|nr:flagellar basal-body rod protein FlgF [Rubricella aquisinus]MBB5515232.1 flagellar basal-body rod protein FlgF [Rubricella aquisinus]